MLKAFIICVKTFVLITDIHFFFITFAMIPYYSGSWDDFYY